MRKRRKKPLLTKKVRGQYKTSLSYERCYKTTIGSLQDTLSRLTDTVRQLADMVRQLAGTLRFPYRFDSHVI